MAVRFHPLPPHVFDEKARPYVSRLNRELRDLFDLEGTLATERTARSSDSSVVRRDTSQVHVTRITPSIAPAVSGVSTVVGIPALVFGTINAKGTTTTTVSTNSSIALFGTALPRPSASVAIVGTSSVAARGDHAHVLPVSLQSTASLTTITLTDDTTNQTLTGSLGTLNLRTAADTLSLPSWTGGGKNAGSVGTVLTFSATTASLPGLLNGIIASVNINDATNYTNATFQGIASSVAPISTAGQTFTNCTFNALVTGFGTASNLGVGPNSFTALRGIQIINRMVAGSGTSVTDYMGIDSATFPVVLTGNPFFTNVHGIRQQFPTTGVTIRRGIAVLATSTGNIGTEVTDSEGFYCDSLPRGTGTRTGYKVLGAGTGTPTSVYGFQQSTAHVVGTNRYGAAFAGATTGTPTACIGVDVSAHSVGTNQWSYRGAQKFENTGTDFIASGTSKGILGQYSDQGGRYFRLRALYNGGAPSLTIDDVGTTLPAS